MKKSFLWVAALATILVACSDKDSSEEPVLPVAPQKTPAAIATFENETGGVNLTTAESAWKGPQELNPGAHTWTSGGFTLSTYVDFYAPSSYYYYAFVVSNETATTSTGYAQPYRNVKGGAYEGDNFAVWYSDWNGNNSIKFATGYVPGFFINNNAYTVNSMCNVASEKFDATNYLVLTCTGKKGGTAVGSIDFYLAKDGKYVVDWTYVDLSSLGEIDEVAFSMDGNKKNSYGLVTPTYFCMDNFGAECPATYVEPARVNF